MTTSGTIGTILHHKGDRVWTIAPGATVFEAIQLLAQKNIGALPVVEAFNSLGTTLGPVFGGILILSTTQVTAAKLHSFSAAALQTYREQQASSVRLPYIGIAIVLFALAAALGLVKMPSMQSNMNTQDFRPGEFGSEAATDSVSRLAPARRGRNLPVCGRRGLSWKLSGQLL